MSNFDRTPTDMIVDRTSGIKLSDSLAQIVTNVKKFGAKGDGVTDDTTSIQNAINSLTNGGTVFFPSGTYIVNTLVLPSKVTLMGSNELTSIIKMSSSASTHLITLATQQTYKCRLSNLKLVGIGSKPYDLVNWVNDGLGAADGFVDHYHQIDNCTISGTGRHGIYVQGSRENIFDTLKIDSCNGNGFYYSNAHDSKISTITVSYCSIGFYLSAASTLKVNACKAFGNVNEGLKMDAACTHDIFTNCELQNNNGNGLTMLSCQRISFKNLILDTNAETSGNELYMDSCLDIRIEGVLRKLSQSMVQNLIQFANNLNDYKIDFVYLSDQSTKVSFLQSNSLVDASTNVLINGREIYNNNILTPNIVTSITNGTLEGFTLEQATGITYINKFDGTAQQFNLTANTSTGTVYIGYYKNIDVSKVSTIGVSCAFEGGNGSNTSDFYRIRVDSLDSGNNVLSSQLITTYGGDETLTYPSVAIPSSATTANVYFEIGIMTTALANYRIINPKIMLGNVR